MKPIIHDVSGYGRGCRCVLCLAARAAYMREYRIRSPKAKEKQAALAKKWYEKNKALTIQRAVDWNKTNIERFTANVRKYEQSEKGKSVKRQYKKDRESAPGAATKQQMDWRWEFYGGKCFRCGVPAEAMDHVIPASRGGSNWPANRRPICNRCNASKGNRVWP